MPQKLQLEIITLCGSVRKDSYNAALLRTLPNVASGDMVFKPGPNVADVPIYDADLER